MVLSLAWWKVCYMLVSSYNCNSMQHLHNTGVKCCGSARKSSVDRGFVERATRAVVTDLGRGLSLYRRLGCRSTEHCASFLGPCCSNRRRSDSRLFVLILMVS